MFLGHYAVGFALKRFAPGTNLGWLIAAPIFLDLVWPVFVLAGLEEVRIEAGNTAVTPLNFAYYPFSHSLAATLGWPIAFAAVYFAVSRYAAGAFAVGLGVLSHWAMDAIVHRPDLPVFPGGPLIGLGLWNSVPGTILIESLLFAAGLVVYARVTRAEDTKGTLAFWGLAAFLVIVYVANLAGPPPPDPRAVAWVTLLTWLFPFWAAWADRHRAVAR